jgi:hypothetical protein
MALFWSLKNVPELAGLSPREKKYLWRQCWRNAYRHWQTIVALALLGIGVGLGQVVGLLLFWPNGESFQDFAPAFIAMFCFGMVAAGTGGFAYGVVLINILRP